MNYDVSLREYEVQSMKKLQASYFQRQPRQRRHIEHRNSYFILLNLKLQSLLPKLCLQGCLNAFLFEVVRIDVFYLLPQLASIFFVTQQEVAVATTFQ